jgi:beta-galactosidase
MFGKGSLTYQGTLPSEALQKSILKDTLRTAGISLEDNRLPAAVMVRHAVLRSGKKAHFYLNFSGEARNFAFGYGDGIDILSGMPAVTSRQIALGPWDLAIIEEN